MQNHIRCTEHRPEELELLPEDLVGETLCGVVLGEEVDDGHIARLTVSMASTDALLDPLRVPWEVVVDQRVGELEVQTLRARLVEIRTRDAVRNS